MVININSVQQS